MINNINKLPFGLHNLDENAVRSVIEYKYSEDLKSSKLINTQAIMALGLLAEKKESRLNENIAYSIFLFAKLIEHHSCVQMLLKYGAVATSRSIVRVMIGCKLQSLALLNDSYIINEILEHSGSEKRKLLNDIIKLGKEFNIIDWNKLGFGEKDVKIPSADINLSVQNRLCNAAYPNDSMKQKGWYILYRLFSVDSHSKADSLNIYEWNDEIGNFEVSLDLFTETLNVANTTLLEVKDKYLMHLNK